MARPVTFQIWIGTFPHRERFEAFVGENLDHYDERYDDDEDGRPPLSEFSGCQGQGFFDHDFFEGAFNDGTGSLAERFATALSCAAEWGSRIESILSQTGANLDPAAVNSVILMQVDDFHDSRPAHRHIRAPRSVTGNDYRLIYVGEMSCMQR